MDKGYRSVGDVFRDFPDLCEDKSYFGNTLEYFIEDRELVRGDFAKQINSSAGALSHWISGRRVPDAATVYAIVDALSLNDKETGLIYNAIKADAATKQLREYVSVANQKGDVSLSNRIIRLVLIDVLQFRKASLVYFRDAHIDAKKKSLSMITDVAKEAGVSVRDLLDDKKVKVWFSKYKIDPVSVFQEMCELGLA